MAELDHGSGGMPRDARHRHPGESGGLTQVLCSGCHHTVGSGRAVQEAGQDFKNG